MCVWISLVGRQNVSYGLKCNDIYFCTMTTCHGTEVKNALVKSVFYTDHNLCYQLQYGHMWHWNDINTKISALVQDLTIVYSSRHTEDVRLLLKDIYEKIQNETTWSATYLHVVLHLTWQVVVMGINSVKYTYPLNFVRKILIWQRWIMLNVTNLAVTSHKHNRVVNTHLMSCTNTVQCFLVP